MREDHVDESTEKDGRVPIVESASATTDPDNSKSGATAYVVFLVVACLLLAFVSSLSSCVNGFADLAMDTADRRIEDVDRRFHEEPRDYGGDEDVFSNEPVSRT